MLGIDIGGAHIKCYHVDGRVRHRSFAVWRDPEGLQAALEDILHDLLPFSEIVLTTSAELCDCFETKRDGVLHVLEALQSAGSRVAPGSSLRVWTLEMSFVDIEVARANFSSVAAANWLALSAYAAGLAPRGAALLADLGSTTLDLVPLRDGKPVPRESTDSGRLVTGELVYTGFRRTPIFALVSELPYRGSCCPVIPELFATTADVYVLLEELVEDSAQHDTADGRALTRERARERLARCVGADRETFSIDDAVLAAEAVAAAQRRQIEEGLRKVALTLGESPRAVIVSGEGENVVRDLVSEKWPGCHLVSLAEEIGSEASSAACAFSLVQLGVRI